MEGSTNLKALSFGAFWWHMFCGLGIPVAFWVSHHFRAADLKSGPDRALLILWVCESHPSLLDWSFFHPYCILCKFPCFSHLLEGFKFLSWLLQATQCPMSHCNLAFQFFQEISREMLCMIAFSFDSLIHFCCYLFWSGDGLNIFWKYWSFQYIDCGVFCGSLSTWGAEGCRTRTTGTFCRWDFSLSLYPSILKSPSLWVTF